MYWCCVKTEETILLKRTETSCSVLEWSLRHKLLFSWPPPVVGQVWLNYFRLQLRQCVTSEMSLSAQVTAWCQNKQFAFIS